MEKNMGRIQLFVSFLLFNLYTEWCVADLQLSPVVDTEHGPVQGLIKQTVGQHKSYSAYRGIPFGKAERFRPPQKPDNWSEIFDATKPGNICMQLDSDNNVIGSEDCLVLNVYTPKTSESSNASYPVMVWIHGGSFTSGSANETYLGPDFLLDNDVIVILLQYRLGPLGFIAMNHPEASGNAGMLDQVRALEWVRDNIANFGGDPSRVTIFGESAGGVSVSHHLFSERSTGLFHGAIIQSGSSLCQWGIISPDTAYHNAFELARKIGFYGTYTVKLLSFLKNMDAREIVKASAPMKLSFLPTKQPKTVVSQHEAFLSECPVKKLSEGKYNNVPIIIGYMADEGAFFASGVIKSSVNSPAFRTLTLDVPELKKLGTKIDEKVVSAVGNLVTAKYFIAPIDNEQTMLASHNNYSIYYYRISRDSPYASHKYTYNISGAAHADDIAYLFNDQAAPMPIDTSNIDGMVRNELVTYWTNFAKYQNPTPYVDANHVVWPDSRPRGEMLDIGDIVKATDRLTNLDLPVQLSKAEVWLTAPGYSGC